MAPSGPRRRDDNDAPWLAEVESDGDASTLVLRGRFIGGVTLFVLLLLLVVIGIYFIVQTKQDGATGTPVARAEDAPLITADPGPYKVRPTDAGGLEVDGSDDIIHCVSEANCTAPLDIAPVPIEEPGPRPGEEPVSLLPADALPAIPPAPASEALPPVAAPVAPAPKAAVPTPGVTAPGTARVPVAKPPVAAVPRPVAPAAAATGTVLQLGAFSSQGKAEQAWKSLSGRFAYLAPLEKRIEAVETASGRLYRLRASGSVDHAAAAQTCARLKVAGENCMVLP